LQQLGISKSWGMGGYLLGEGWGIWVNHQIDDSHIEMVVCCRCPTKNNGVAPGSRMEKHKHKT